MNLSIKNLEELPNAAQSLLDFAGNRKKWCFYGDLGTGKTTLIKAIGTVLKLQEAVTSPTYSLVNEYTYTLPNATEEQYLYHLDLYRLKQFEEALDIGIEEYLYNLHYCFIEWAEIIESILPEDTLKIYLEITDNGVRKISCV